MQETSEWDCLTRGCAVLREPRAEISSFVEGSVTVMVLSGTRNVSPALLTPDLLWKTFLFLPRGLTLVVYNLYFIPKSVFFCLCICCSFDCRVVGDIYSFGGACFLLNNSLFFVKCCGFDTREALQTCSPSLGLLSGASLVGALIQKGH